MKCGVSPRQLHRYFLECFSMTPARWIDAVRVRVAASLIAQGKTGKEAAFESGFKQPSHFCRVFKRLYGVPPAAALTARPTSVEMSVTDNKCP